MYWCRGISQKSHGNTFIALYMSAGVIYEVTWPVNLKWREKKILFFSLNADDWLYSGGSKIKQTKSLIQEYWIEIFSSQSNDLSFSSRTACSWTPHSNWSFCLRICGSKSLFGLVGFFIPEFEEHFEGNAAHVGLNYCHGEKLPVHKCQWAQHTSNGWFSTRDHQDFPVITAAVAAGRRWCEAWPLLWVSLLETEVKCGYEDFCTSAKPSWLCLFLFPTPPLALRPPSAITSSRLFIPEHTSSQYNKFPYIIENVLVFLSECQCRSEIGRVSCLTKKTQDPPTQVSRPQLWCFPSRRASTPLKLDDIKVASGFMGMTARYLWKYTTSFFAQREESSSALACSCWLCFVPLN